MKKLFTSALIAASFYATADSGSAVVSHIYGFQASASNYADTFIYLTNIAKSDVRVTVSLYRDDGSLISDTDNNSISGLLKASNVTSYSDSNTTSSMSFSLAPDVSTKVWLDTPSNEIYGYAVVEWSTNNESTSIRNVNSLVGHTVVYRVYNGTGNGVGYYSVPINDGKPF